jgi:hypothetical protein
LNPIYPMPPTPQNFPFAPGESANNPSIYKFQIMILNFGNIS